MSQRAKSQSNRGKLMAMVGAAAISLGALSGCEAPDWENPDYVAKKLLEGDGAEKSLAVENLRRFPEERRAEVVPALVEIYKAGDRDAKEAMSYLVEWRVKEAADAYVKEMQTDATGYAGAAAVALGQIGHREAVPLMLEALSATDNSERKQALLSGMSRLPDPAMVGPMVELLKLDADNYPIALHAYACEILGNIGEENPAAVSEEARDMVVLGMFLSNNTNQNTNRECGLAAQQIGPTMVPHLVKTFNGEHQAVNQLLLKYNQGPDYAFPANQAKLVSTVRLSSMRAPEAVALFVEDLSNTKSAPEGLSGRQSVSWRLKEGNATDEMILGLGDLGDASTRELLERIVSGKLEKEWDEITDGLVELQLRQDAATALARLGDRQALGVLMEMASTGVIVDLERRFAMLEKQGRPGKEEERYQFNWMAAKAYAMLAEASHREAYQGLIDATDDGALKEKYVSFLPAFDVAAECGAKGDAAAQAACYGTKIEDENPIVREKAAYELSRLGAAASPVVAKAITTKHLDTRELLTFAGYRVATPALAEAVAALIEDEKGRSGDDARRDRNRLKLLHAYALRAGSGAAQAAE
ncbi:hypothetical protein DL240_05410 [Lujinxingia litoralis]|uniref:HEAT repeat domain-containing protein n=1 Tax=Lujinxingia litoralis TaxID=2211119 RepID=A0A328C9I3_9DELT|nr:hypothetical protein [Lujinxingia litoralis]RAL23598.1 hypothetical protein DL240_05410 [Lujinxingia litoralis]